MVTLMTVFGEKLGPKRHKPWPIQKFKVIQSVSQSVSQSFNQLESFRKFQKVSESVRKFQKVSESF